MNDPSNVFAKHDRSRGLTSKSDTKNRFQLNDEKVRANAAASGTVPVAEPDVIGEQTPKTVDQIFRAKVAKRDQAKANAGRGGSVADDRKNRFKLHDEAEAAKRRNTAAHDARVKKLADDKARWQREQKSAATAAGGTSLPADLQALKAKERAYTRGAKQRSGGTINLSTLTACITHWRLNSAHGRAFINVAFNLESMNNAIQAKLLEGHEVSPEAIEAAYIDAVAGNHIYLYKPTESVGADGTVVRKRGSAISSPPTMFPAVIWPSDQVELDAAAMRKALEQHKAETKELLKVDFADLQAKVRSGYKPANRTSNAEGGVR